MKRWMVAGLMAVAMGAGLLGACASWQLLNEDKAEALQPAGGVELVDTYWKLVEVAGKPVAGVNLPAREPYLTLQSNEGEPRLAGFSGCNRMGGSYALEAHKISFAGKVVMTRMACAHGMDVEADFAQALDNTVSWGVEGTTLRFYDAAGDVVAKFEQRLL